MRLTRSHKAGKGRDGFFAAENFVALWLRVSLISPQESGGPHPAPAYLRDMTSYARMERLLRWLDENASLLVLDRTTGELKSVRK